MLYLNKPTEETAEPMLTNSISERVFAREVCIFGVNVKSMISQFEGVKIPKNSKKIGPNKHFTAKSASSEIAIYQSLMKIFASNLTDRSKTGSTIQNLQN